MRVLTTVWPGNTKSKTEDKVAAPGLKLAQHPQSYQAAGVLSAFVVPFIAALSAAILYAAEPLPQIYPPMGLPAPIIEAAVFVVVFWLVVARLYFVLGFTSAPIANATSFADLAKLVAGLTDADRAALATILAGPQNDKPNDDR